MVHENFIIENIEIVSDFGKQRVRDAALKRAV